MTPKAPAMLVVLVETERLRWFVAAVDLDGPAMSLLRSEDSDLEKVRTVDFDEQVAFLRHRFCGILQRGIDRGYGVDLVQTELRSCPVVQIERRAAAGRDGIPMGIVQEFGHDTLLQSLAQEA